MSANGVNRSVARKALGALLKAQLAGDGKPAQEVYDHRVGDFEGQSPVVVVTSTGSKRQQTMLTSSTRRVTVALDIFIFVLYSDPEAGWTEEDAEDRLDLLEKSISDILVDNVKSTSWNMLTVTDKTQIDSMVIGGKEFMRETIPVSLDIVMG